MAASRQSSGRCDRKSQPDGVRKASRSRASDSPLPGEHKDVRMARPENDSPRGTAINTHHEAEEARCKRSTGRDSRFGLARPVP